MSVEKIIVAGGRDFDDKWLMACVLKVLIPVGDEIVNGMCPTGADNLARLYALNYNHPVAEFPAHWDALGRTAGPIRNAEMADYADVLIAFWDGKSAGTKDMIAKALAKGLEVHVYRY